MILDCHIELKLSEHINILEQPKIIKLITNIVYIFIRQYLLYKFIVIFSMNMINIIK